MSSLGLGSENVSLTGEDRTFPYAPPADSSAALSGLIVIGTDKVLVIACALPPDHNSRATKAKAAFKIVVFILKKR